MAIFLSADNLCKQFDNLSKQLYPGQYRQSIRTFATLIVSLIDFLEKIILKTKSVDGKKVLKLSNE